MEQNKTPEQIAISSAKIAIPTVLLLGLATCSFATVESGHRGILRTMGAVHKEALSEGFHLKAPLIQDIQEMDVRLIQFTGNTETYTKDIQQATVQYAVSYNLNPTDAALVFQNVGKDWGQTLLFDLIPNAMKNVVGKWDAIELISNRDKVTPPIQEALKQALAHKLLAKGLPEDAVTISAFSIADISYTPEFEKAVESKVTAVQRAEEEQNKTVQIQEQAKQKIISAKAEAESIQIRAEALSKNKSLVEWEAVQKWDGKMPHITGGAVPFINIDSNRKTGE